MDNQEEIEKRFVIESLQAQEDFFSSIVQNAKEAIISINAQGNIILWNKAAELMFGYSYDEVIGKQITIIMPQESHMPYSHAMKHFSVTGEAKLIGKTVEVTAIRKDGRELIVEMFISLWSKGEAPIFTAILNDITKRKNEEEDFIVFTQFRQTLNSLLHIALYNISLEEQLKQALDEILSIKWIKIEVKGGIFLIDPQTNTLELKVHKNLSPLVIEMCNKVSIDECLCGLAISTRSIILSSCAEYTQNARICDDTSPHLHYSIPIITKDILLGVLMLYVPETHKSSHREMEFIENVASILAGMIDHKKAEEALKESEDQLHAIIDTATEAIITINEEGIIKACNKACEVIFGYNTNELLGHSVNMLMPEPYKSAHDGYIQRYIQSGRSRVIGSNIELIGLKKSGVIFPIDIALSEVSFNYKRLFTALIRDISERKNTEKMLLQSEKMASIGQLAAGVAHEINNPMGFISSNIKTLGKYVDKIVGFIEIQTEILKNIDAKEAIDSINAQRKKLKVDYVVNDMKHLIEESLDGADRVKKIVMDLKSFSRIDKAEYIEANIGELIDSALNIIWNELKYKCTVQKEYAAIAPLKCYPQQLSQVFINILVNAAHAIKERGEIEIKTWEDNNNVLVSIKDNGSGMSEEIKDKIFEPFFTTKDVEKGTGLGLSIAFDIIKKHNGIIQVESELQKGTTFTVSLPRERRQK
ncbi:MAG: PAS domain S-box protein [Candidatus Magnetoovum sp. WYHC-5]|nr:PAS domain S-box protein [Candidatus Magnetoovum sp. WYHC-5]